MAFTLKTVVPWGRTLAEYRAMFRLEDGDLTRRIISFGDGPASFNAEMAALGRRVISVDPLYSYPPDAIREHILETRTEVMTQVRAHQQAYNWTDAIPDPEALEKMRMTAMARFLEDVEKGSKDGRYIAHALPGHLPLENGSFELGLSSHFLLLYASLGWDFHRQAITEMLRVCDELRIFPTVDLNGHQPAFMDELIRYFSPAFEIETIETAYHFQKGGNRCLRIRKQRP